jgi:hypothetical protein
MRVTSSTAALSSSRSVPATDGRMAELAGRDGVRAQGRMLTSSGPGVVDDPEFTREAEIGQGDKGTGRLCSPRTFGNSAIAGCAESPLRREYSPLEPLKQIHVGRALRLAARSAVVRARQTFGTVLSNGMRGVSVDGRGKYKPEKARKIRDPR